MIVGIPKEVKTRENRIAIVPGGVEQLVASGHKVLIQSNAGFNAGIPNEKFVQAGASIVESADELWQQSEMIIKVKEPIEEEFHRMREGQILYTYLHLAADRKLTEKLLEKKVSAIAYETIQLEDHSLPLLKPMSEVAGRMSIQVGVKCLEKHNGGKGLLLGGVPGVKRGQVSIVGGGIVGVNAAKMAIGLGANVTVLDIDQARLAYLDDIFGTRVTTLMSNPENIAESVTRSDLVVGAVLVTGAKAPILVSKAVIEQMEPGSAVVDVAIDQGGSIETIRPTTHDDPVYKVCGVNHYGVTNIPGDVPMTSTYALTNVTTHYAVKLANMGFEKALRSDRALLKGLNTHQGVLTHEAVSQALDIPFQPWE